MSKTFSCEHCKDTNCPECEPMTNNTDKTLTDGLKSKPYIKGNKIVNGAYRLSECGCEIIGDASNKFPLCIEYCDAHTQANEQLEQYKSMFNACNNEGVLLEEQLKELRQQLDDSVSIEDFGRLNAKLDDVNSRYFMLSEQYTRDKDVETKLNLEEQLEQANALLEECEDEFHRIRINEDSYDDEQTVLGEIFLACESMENKLKERKG